MIAGWNGRGGDTPASVVVARMTPALAGTSGPGPSRVNDQKYRRKRESPVSDRFRPAVPPGPASGYDANTSSWAHGAPRTAGAWVVMVELSVLLAAVIVPLALYVDAWQAPFGAALTWVGVSAGRRSYIRYQRIRVS
jgi:hypothetical protein